MPKKTPRTQLYSSALCHQRSCWHRSRERSTPGHLRPHTNGRGRPTTGLRRRAAGAPLPANSPPAPGHGDRRCVPPAGRCRSRWASCTSCSRPRYQGRGSDVPGSCAHADPFFLCDAVRLPRDAKPPFCAHPHSGAGVLSLCCSARPAPCGRGTTCKARRNRCARAASITSTRAGCVHDGPSTRYRAGRRSTGASTSGAPIPADGDAVGAAPCDALPEDETRRGPVFAVGRPEAASRATKGSPCEYLSVLGGVTDPAAALPLSSSTGLHGSASWHRALGITVHLGARRALAAGGATLVRR